MKRLLALVLALAWVSPVLAAEAEQEQEQEPGTHNTLTESEQQAGWRLLFNGENFDGWRGLGRDHIPAKWEVVDGTIWKKPPPNEPDEESDIITIETFENFELVFEWKVDTASNSGIKYNVSEELSATVGPTHGALGFEYQVIDEVTWPSRLGPMWQVAGLYDLVPPPAEKPLRAVGEWNASRIVLRGNRGEHWLNGRLLVAYDLSSEDFQQRLAASKFAPTEGFAERRSGHISLQDHNGQYWYRNIKIRELPTWRGRRGGNQGNQDN